MLRRNTISTALATAFALVVLSCVLHSPWRSNHSPTAGVAITLPELARTNLLLIDGRWHRIGQSNAFTGFLIDRYGNGTLCSRSAVSNGVLHGISEGWYTNGQRQVSERFVEGVSNGRRTKWYPNGMKLSESEIVAGKFHGTFRRWTESGTLTEQVGFANGHPHGLAMAYFPSGCLKSRATMQEGKVVAQRSWSDGEQKGPLSD